MMRRPSAISFVVLALSGFQAASADTTIPVGTYQEPAYTNKELPAISACDPATVGEDGIPKTGNAWADIATSTATNLNKAYGRSSGNAKDEQEKSAYTLDTDCDKLFKVTDLNMDAESMSCGELNDAATVARLIEAGKAHQAKLACESGVLKAVRGELACFKKQIGEAEAFINSLVMGKGGLSDMLTAANTSIQQMDQEIQDRTAQMKTIDERINGGPNKNPPGLLEAKQALEQLTTKLPSVTTEAESLAVNFQKTVQQAETAQIMQCLNTPIAGATCVSDGTSSALYPSGSVSLLQQISCLSSQSVNQVTQKGVVGDRAAEQSLFKTALTQIDLKGKIRENATLSTKIDDYAALQEYELNTPAELNAELRKRIASLRAKDSAQSKSFLAAFDARYRSCAQQATQKITTTKTSTERGIKSKNAGIYRDLRNQYSRALQAATGKSIMLNTAECESGSLAAQTTCFQRLNKMVDCLYTGQSCSSGAISGASIGLTNGAGGLKDFLGTVAATNNPARSLAVACSGINDCLAQYSSLRTGLQTAVETLNRNKETLKTNVNQSLQKAAANLASGKDPNTGANLGYGMTVTRLTTNIEAVKAKIAAAMGRLNLGSSLDLDPKEVPEPGVDERTGLYKANDLKSLVMQAIQPGLPDANSSGFKDATSAIADKEKEIGEERKKLAKYESELRKAKAKCEKDARDQACKEPSSILEKCNEVKSKLDELSDTIDEVNNALDPGRYSTLERRRRTQEAELRSLNLRALEMIGEQGSTMIGNDEAATTCGIAREAYAQYCGYGQKRNTSESKDDQEIGSGRRAGGGSTAGGLGSYR